MTIAAESSVGGLERYEEREKRREEGSEKWVMVIRRDTRGGRREE